MDVEPRAVRYIAKAADGSMRDALSLLDQCVAFYINSRLTYDNVLEVLGAVDTSVFSRLLRCIISQQMTEAIYLLEDIVTQGRELYQFVIDFTWYLRNLMLAQNADNLEDILDISTENLEALKEEAKMVKPEVIMRYIRVFSELSGQMRYSTQKRVLLEVALVKLCKPSMERNMDSILNRLANIERQLEQGIAVVPGVHQQTAEAALGQEEAPAANVSRPKAMSEDVKQVIAQWGQIVSDLPTSMAAMTRNIRVSQADDSTILLACENEMQKSYFEQENHKKELEDIIGAKIQKQLTIKAVFLSNEQPQQAEAFIDPRKMNLEGVDLIYED